MRDIAIRALLVGACTTAVLLVGQVVLLSSDDTPAGLPGLEPARAEIWVSIGYVVMLFLTITVVAGFVLAMKRRRSDAGM